MSPEGEPKERWGEIMKRELLAEIAKCVTHRELIGWGLGIASAFLAAALYLGSLQAKGAVAAANEAKTSVVEVQKDVRSLYRAVLTREPQKRLERPVPEPAKAAAP